MLLNSVLLEGIVRETKAFDIQDYKFRFCLLEIENDEKIEIMIPESILKLENEKKAKSGARIRAIGKIRNLNLGIFIQVEYIEYLGRESE